MADDHLTEGTDASAKAALKATQDILAAIRQHRGDEKPVFDVILENACRLCNAQTAFVAALDHAETHLVIPAWRGASDAFADGLKEFRHAVTETHLTAVQAMVERQVIRIDDIADTDTYREGEPVRVFMVDVENIRSLATVPLLSEGRGIGSILLYRREVDPFTDDDIALIEGFAEQAVIAIENARQFRELQERLEREKASAEILDVISRSRNDEAPVFDVILENAARLCDAPMAGLVLLNKPGDTLMVERVWGDEDSRLELPANGFAVDGDFFPARAFRAAEILHIPDIGQVPEFIAGNPRYVALVEERGFHSYLCVPLLQNGKPIGCIDLFRTKAAPFSDRQIALVKTFATQAIIAIENVRQFREVQERLERERASAEILEVISKSRDDEQPVFDVILEQAARLCRSPQAGLIMPNESRTHVRYTASWGPPTQHFEVGVSEWEIDEPIAITTAIRECRTVNIPDTLKDAATEAANPSRMEIIEKEGIRSVLAVPLVMQGEAIGCFDVYRTEVDPFSEDDIALMETFAAQAVIAIENVRQFREVQERLERERASAEILEVISKSRDDEKPVFDTILENTAHLCQTDLATFNLMNNEATHLEYAAHYGRSLHTYEVGVDRWSIDSTLQIAESVREGRIVHNVDLRETQLYMDGDRWRRQLADEEGVRSFLTVPLITAGGKPIGCIGIYRKEVRAFSDDEIALVETFAAQAVIAIENVRQFREVQERLEREAATSEVLGVISRSRDDDTPVFDTILKNAQRLCGATNGAIVLGEEGGGAQILAAQTGASEDTLERYRAGGFLMDPSTSVAARAIVSGETLYYPKITEGEPYREGMEAVRMHVETERLQTSLYVPLMLDGKGIGCINLLHREQRNYRPDEIALVETFARQAVIAIESVRQFREVQERLEREEATGDVLGVISTSRDDEIPVFETILENASRLCNAPIAFLSLASDDRSNVIIPAHRGTRSEFGDILEGFSEPITRTELVAVRPVATGETVLEDDIKDDDAYRRGDPRRLQMVDVEGARSVLAVPLIQGGTPIGAIVLYRREVAPFSADDLSLVQSFAAQAVIAIENVRQFREVQERLERERATKEVLSVISQSRDDETPVFEKILTLARELCEAEMSTLLLVNPDRTALTYVGAAGKEIGNLERGFTIPLDDPMGVTTAVRTGEVVNNPDLKDDDLYRQGHPVRVRLVDEEGILSQLAVPLLQGDQTIGVLALNRREQKAFTADEVALIESFAAQAVIAIENVRQFREVQERLEREEATGNVLSVISTSRDDDGPVFDMILEASARLCDSPTASLLLLNDDGTALIFRAVWGEPFIAFKPEETIFNMDSDLVPVQALRKGETIHIADMSTLETYKRSDPVAINAVDVEGIRTFLSVPLILNGAAIGTINLFRREVRPFDERQVSLVAAFAAQAVIAIENVRQFKALETLNAELGDRVESQVGEIERMGRLKRFLPSAVADAVVTSGDESMLTSHRAMVATLFCDMRGFTAFCEAAEPEETIEVLQTYHQEMSDLIDEYGGGVDQRAGDGIMVIFNDPIPVDDPAGDAVRLAVAMREKMKELCAKWKRLGHRLGFGVGISLGYATVGMVGSAGRFDYTASGTSVNTAARLCDMAADGEVLISPRVWVAVEGDFQAESRGEVEMKGIREPVEVFAVS